MPTKNEIKAAVDIEAFARDRYGLEFDAKGRGHCPFSGRHNNGDRNPSAFLHREKQRIWCNSQGCFDGTRGVDTFGIVRVMDQCDFPTALQVVADYAAIPTNGQHKLQSGKPKQRIVATFDYQDEYRNLLYQVVRREPGKNGGNKDFVIRQPNEKGGWNWTSEGARLVPYRLSELLKKKGIILIPEGEKCVDALWKLGIAATCNPFGAGKWRNGYNGALKDRDVVIWPDKDESGHSHALQVAKSLMGVAKLVRVIDPPDDLPQKGDVVDGIEKHGWTRENVLAIVKTAKPFDPESCPPPPIGERGQEDNKITLIPRGAADLIQNSPEVAWLVNGILPVGRALLLTGPSGTGKSWMSLDLALSVDQGGKWLQKFPCQQGRVLVVDEENGDGLLKRRLTKLLQARGLPPDGSACGIQFLSMAGVNLSDEVCATALEKVISEMRPNLLIFDTFVRIHTSDESSAREMAPISRLFKEWFTAYGCAFCINHHDRKPGASGHDSQYAFRGSTEIQAFTDSHIDLRGVKNERGILNVEHVKARFSEPLEPFGVEIADVGDGTVIRHTEHHETKTRTKQGEAENFIRGLMDGGEWMSRKEINARGGEASHSENTLDVARLAMVDAEEIEQKNAQDIGQAGSGVFVRCLLSSCPDIPIGEEEEDKRENLPEKQEAEQ